MEFLKNFKLILKFILFMIIFVIVFNNINYAQIYNPNKYDLVIKNAYIFNPSTEHELENHNIGIKGEKIIRITQENLDGESIIDASGCIVSPGFIDLISYDPNKHGIKFKVLDGVTSNIAMHGGTEDASSWYDYWEKEKPLTNFGASSFITRLRWPIVGYGVDAELESQEQIEQLVSDVRKNIEEGALGISFSFEYVPGIKNEIIPLLELAKEYKAPTFYHLRYSSKEKELDGVKEVIDYGKITDAPIHIMHINSTGGTFHMKEALEMISKARKEGLDISSCIYPYDFWATYIDSARFREGWQDRFNISYEDLQLGGTDIRLSKDTFPEYRKKHLLVAAHNSIPEESNILALKDPYVMIGSDTIIEEGGNNHPRGAGTYARIFSKYVREDKLISMMDAIKKVSYLPAKRLEEIAPSMKYKGRIEVGADADLTIFNPNTIKDNSSVENTELSSSGIEYVIINGQIVKDKKGIVEDVFPGKPIKSYFVDKIEDNQPLSKKLTLNGKEIEITKSYKVNENLYYPLVDLANLLEKNIDCYKNGEIKIDKLNLKVGDKNFYIDGEKYPIKYEPIIYKSNIYMEEESVKEVFNKLNQYESANRDEEDSPSNKDRKKPSYSINKTYIILTILILIIGILAIKNIRRE